MVTKTNSDIENVEDDENNIININDLKNDKQEGNKDDNDNENDKGNNHLNIPIQ